ncbi:unnamed protein product [Clonostachys rosea f. rosea IK726]|uniref:Uncharacterized protein n=1 Tax=Clonostachys rosea f. rosea IK726 TaxID=1349383 RepID=A0ACA9U6L3_BIOOC|nr:unnamed protein product [Clonostachys rosea f. rosea IK726]
MSGNMRSVFYQSRTVAVPKLGKRLIDSATEDPEQLIIGLFYGVPDPMPSDPFWIITAAHSLGIAWKLPNTFTVPNPPMGQLHLIATFGLQD